MRSYTHHALPLNETWHSNQSEQDEMIKARLLLACVCPLFGKSFDIYNPGPFTPLLTDKHDQNNT